MIRVRVPGTLAYRNLALRVVAAACKMIGNEEVEPSAAADEFEAQTVSAVGEAYNNVAIHAYDGVPVGEIDISIESTADRVVIEMTDTGKSFDPSAVALPDLDQLPESGMGLFIIRSFMDEMTYAPGPPSNVLRLVKRRAHTTGRPAGDGEGRDHEAEVIVESGKEDATA
ncbi:MAG TPA: ATP-binding protein [Minicystis sp.]|nr:ATP-binding protein [Minicystis sp.]